MPAAEPIRVIVVDDDATFRRVFGGALEEQGFNVDTAANGVDALEVMNRRSFDVALVDLRMPAMDGLSLLAEMRRRHPAILPVVLTGYGSVPSTVDAMRSGARDVISKSMTVEAVAQVIRQAAEDRLKSRLEPTLRDALFTREAYYGIVGRSAAIQQVFRAIERFQDADQPALICGESGTGKELVARALHSGGRRKNRPLIAVNCSSLKENFVENELFGHVRGAFTGALAAKQGLFALADGGSLHIDEIGEMPESAQAALLRVLDNGTYRQLGGIQEEQVDARVLASTNRDLERMIDSGGFRQDLYYRLCVCRIDLPPLRQRREDIPLLINHFLDSSANARHFGASIGKAALDALTEHDWPGNVRELFNVLDRAVLMAGSSAIEVRHLGRARSVAPRSQIVTSLLDELPTMEQLERVYVERLMRHEGGNLTAVARILGVDPTTVRRKLRRWQLPE